MKFLASPHQFTDPMVDNLQDGPKRSYDVKWKMDIWVQMEALNLSTISSLSALR
jgi:hypothetical protein